MPDRIQSYKIIANGGLNTNQNFLELADNRPGAATRLVNFESSLSGGYRRINGFRHLDPAWPLVTSGAVPAEGAVLGIFGFSNTAVGNFQTIACRKTVGSNVYRFYLLTGGGWVAINTGPARSSLGVTIVRHEIFHDGDVNYIAFVDGVNPTLVFDGTTWYTLTSTNTGGSSSPGGDQIVDAPSFISVIKGYLFIGGDPSAPGVLSYSAPNDLLTWTAAAGGGQQVINFRVVTIKPFRDELYVFGQNAVKKSVPDATASWLLEDVTTNLGCVARDSVFELAGNLVYLSNDGLRVVAGTARIGDVDLAAISNDIREEFFRIGVRHSLDRLRCVVIREKAQFRYFFNDPNTDVDKTEGLIGCLKARGDVSWEFGQLLGIRNSCTWSGLSDVGEEIVLHGDFDGAVFRQEVGNSFNGSNIFSVYSSPYYDMGDTEIRKTLRNINTFTKAEGGFEMAIGFEFDWADSTAITPGNYNESAGGQGAIYDAGFQYDTGAKYTNSIQPILHTNIQGSCYAAKVNFVSDGVFAPYTLQGFVLEFSTKGRQ